MTDTIQNLTSDDFGHIIGNNRSGTATDKSYAYDNLNGWTTQIKSAGGYYIFNGENKPDCHYYVAFDFR